MTPKARRFWPLLVLLAVTDCATKRLALERLAPAYVPHPIAGDVVRLTLTYNRAAAFGINPGRYGRWVLVSLSLGVLAVLAELYRRAAVSDRALGTALALLAGGAIGNLLDRLRSPRGVVDFIDIGLGRTRFWTFNLADLGISLGAVLLVMVLWRRAAGRRDGRHAPPGPIPPA